jgi:23S rRNA pseudouridine1911/1915/1917 synthase
LIPSRSPARRFIVTDGGPLLTYLLGALGSKRAAVKKLLKFGAVAVNGNNVRQFDHTLATGDEVLVQQAKTAVAASRLERAKIHVVHEDDALIVLDKPVGLLTVATDDETRDTLLFRLNEFLRMRDPAHPQRALVVHRLDRETSGLVLFAKNAQVKRLLEEGWPAVGKIYHAVVERPPDQPEGTITSYLTETTALHVFSNDHETPGGRLSVTRYRLLETRGWFSLLEVYLDTGRKHQIRVHLAEIRCRVTGDRRYGARHDPFGRLGLHASRLALAHPVTGEPLIFESRAPAQMRRWFPKWLDRGNG